MYLNVFWTQNYDFHTIVCIVKISECDRKNDILRHANTSSKLFFCSHFHPAFIVKATKYDFPTSFVW